MAAAVVGRRQVRLVGGGLALLAAGCVVAPFEPLGKRCTQDAPCPEPLLCLSAAGADGGYCLNGTAAPLTLLPTQDVHFKGGTFYDQAILSVENAGAGRTSTAFLRFKVEGLQALPLSASLIVTNFWDAKRNGSYRASLGSHSSWTATTITSANAPTAVKTLTIRSGSIEPLAEASFDVSSGVAANGDLTLLLEGVEGTEPLVLHASSSTAPPRLVVQHAALPAPR